MKKITALLLSMCFTKLMLAQDEQSLLHDVEDDKQKKEYVTNAFKSSRVINCHSMEMIGKEVLDFRILHRFGRVNQGFKQLFGLDQASMRMGFDYGLQKNISIGIGRSTLKKELDGFVKYRLAQQAKGNAALPVSVILIAGMVYNGIVNSSPVKKENFNTRSAYHYQIIVGKKLTTKYSLQLSSMLVHRNITDISDNNDIYGIGFGGRAKLTKRIALVADYWYVLNGLPKTTNRNPLSFGIDIETGGHVFQLHFSNTSGMNERAFITETTNNWAKGDIQFGFNLSRVFSIGKRHKVQS